MTIGHWTRTIENGYEPNNRIKIVAELSEDGKNWHFIGIYGNLYWNDGPSEVEISRDPITKAYEWQNDRESGTTETFLEAWEKMPGFVTNPDEYEDGQIEIITP
jgi:hypothetical protein